MSSAAEIASVARELAAIDRRLDDLWWRADAPMRERLDAIYRAPMPAWGRKLAALAAEIEEDERAIVEAKLS
jgi:hypothetical protein